MLKFLKNIFTLKTPRYLYKLDQAEFNERTHKYTYVFKMYGGHEFLKRDFAAIKSNRDLRMSINPDDLIFIYKKEQLRNIVNMQYRIVVTHANNWYTIQNIQDYKKLSGNDICSSPDLIKEMSPLDVFKIAYETGFRHGQAVKSKATNITKIAESDKTSNVTSLKVYTNKP